jgi:multiple antibiotic resistance protein
MSALPDELYHVLNSFLLVYAGLFPIVNPIGGAPIFLGLTTHATAKERALLSRQVAINGFFLLLGSLFVGSHVLDFFGVTLPVVRIAGGLIIATFGWRLLYAAEPSEDQRGAASRTSGPTDAFYPLTMPLTVGPGSISVAITLGTQRPRGKLDLADLALLGGGAVAGILAIAVTIYVCYRFAPRIVSTIGKTGTNVLIRLMAFIELCIGIQIIWGGVSDLIGTLPN